MKNGRFSDDEMDASRHRVPGPTPQWDTTGLEADPWGDLRDFVTLSIEAEEEADGIAAPAVVALAFHFAQMSASLAC